MSQLSEEQKQRLLTRVRGTLATMRRMEHDDTKAHAYVRDVTKLLTLLDSDSQAAETFAASTAPVADRMITVLEDIRGFYSTSNCWCDADGESPHFEQCERAAEFYEWLKLSRSSGKPIRYIESESTAATTAPVEQSSTHEFVGDSKSLPCGYCGFIYSAPIHRHEGAR